MSQLYLFLLSALRALVEVALLALLGQGVLAFLAGALWAGRTAGSMLRRRVPGSAPAVGRPWPDELAKGVVQVKDLRRQEQFEVPRTELVASLRVEIEQTRAMPLNAPTDAA